MALLHGLLLAIALGQTPAADSTASIRGRVATSDDHPLRDAQIVVHGLVRGAISDAQGRFELKRLPPGTFTLTVRAIGYGRKEVVVVLHAGERLTRNVSFDEPDVSITQASHDSALAVVGLLDSIAAGLVKTDTATAFSYERFGIKLLRAAVAAGSPDSSRVLSPLSAGQALALALNAAGDSTALAIERGLELGRLGETGIAERTRRFNESLGSRRDVELHVADALWVDTTDILRPAFAHRARTHYGAVVRSLPLHDQAIVGIVNHWADSVTRGKIPTIREQPFDSSAVVVLTNAVYFKGRWLVPFDSGGTVDRPFTTATGVRLATPTMTHTAYLAYRRVSGYQALRVPYNAGLTAMYLVLPDSGNTPARVLVDLEQTGWPIPDPQKEVQDVALRLPKLHIEQATDLKPPLETLKMGILFDRGRADFGNLVRQRSDLPPECPPLSSGARFGDCTRHAISEARQHVYLDVDEKGTEAAAVTSLTLVTLRSVPPPPIPFYVDRPFLFALRDERTGVMLFVGFIAGPHQ